MAQSIALGGTAVPAGTRVFTIDTLPANTSGFSLVLGRDASWLGAGKLFDLLLEFSQDGITFNKWLECGVNKGAALNKDGSTATTFRLSGTWPGAAKRGGQEPTDAEGYNLDANGQRIRGAIAAASLRVTLTVPSTFTVASIAMSVA
jgi:hypothetical protein